MDVPRRYPLHEFPFAQSAEEEDYCRQVHYFTNALWVYGAADDVLTALRAVWQQVMDRATQTSDPAQ
jgi:hypothetical protein